MMMSCASMVLVTFAWRAASRSAAVNREHALYLPAAMAGVSGLDATSNSIMASPANLFIMLTSMSSAMRLRLIGSFSDQQLSELSVPKRRPLSGREVVIGKRGRRIVHETRPELLILHGAGQDLGDGLQAHRLSPSRKLAPAEFRGPGVLEWRNPKDMR
jgi:hypothetical protein